MVSDKENSTESAWMDIGTIEDLPSGTMKRYDLGRRRILVANVEGTPLAVADTCTHEDASLSMGALQGDKVKCPLHGSRFCLRDGQALDEPAEVDLECYTVRRNNGRLEIAINRDDS